MKVIPDHNSPKPPSIRKLKRMGKRRLKLKRKREKMQKKNYKKEQKRDKIKQKYNI